ncbi:ETSous factor-like 2, partial [Homarus americanus]
LALENSEAEKLRAENEAAPCPGFTSYSGAQVPLFQSSQLKSVNVPHGSSSHKERTTRTALPDSSGIFSRPASLASGESTALERSKADVSGERGRLGIDDPMAMFYERSAWTVKCSVGSILPRDTDSLLSLALYLPVVDTNEADRGEHASDKSKVHTENIRTHINPDRGRYSSVLRSHKNNNNNNIRMEQNYDDLEPSFRIGDAVMGRGGSIADLCQAYLGGLDTPLEDLTSVASARTDTSSSSSSCHGRMRVTDWTGQVELWAKEILQGHGVDPYSVNLQPLTTISGRQLLLLSHTQLRGFLGGSMLVTSTFPRDVWSSSTSSHTTTDWKASGQNKNDSTQWTNPMPFPQSHNLEASGSYYHLKNLGTSRHFPDESSWTASGKNSNRTSSYDSPGLLHDSTDFRHGSYHEKTDLGPDSYHGTADIRSRECYYNHREHDSYRSLDENVPCSSSSSSFHDQQHTCPSTSTSSHHDQQHTCPSTSTSSHHDSSQHGPLFSLSSGSFYSPQGWSSAGGAYSAHDWTQGGEDDLEPPHQLTPKRRRRRKQHVDSDQLAGALEEEPSGQVNEDDVSGECGGGADGGAGGAGDGGADSGDGTASTIDLEHFLSGDVLKKIPSKTRKRVRGPKSWEFLIRLLLDKRTNPLLIRWEEESTATFRLMQPETIAKMWAQRGVEKANLSYNNFARGLRYHYATGGLEPVSERQLVYRCGPDALTYLEDMKNQQ